MPGLPWTCWHEVVRVREDVRTGELPLHIFAADLYDVAVGRAPVMYRAPEEFFALTYPTFNLRELVKDVFLRLAGRSDKAVRQLELTYGGGKTHALMTLYHLTKDPDTLPDLPSVKEFIEHAGLRPPRARIAILAFDKIDAEKGSETLSPSGERRWLKHPWSVMAYQLAGSRGLRLLHPDDVEAERDSPPAENLLSELLAFPREEGLSTLVLIDEVLAFARGKIGLDPNWVGRLMSFFQFLTQAATKVDSAAIVASLLASDPKLADTLGKQIARELYNVFRRESEEGIQPVLKEDAAEVLRRRFFTPASIQDHTTWRSHVVAAMKGIAEVDEDTRREGQRAEERYLASYPFHPDLTDIFYGKWTSLEGFQRTRGVLRTFALALRDAERWDRSPLVGTSVFLGPPDGGAAISNAARELTRVAGAEEYEGRRQEWTAILEGELDKAGAIQRECPALQFRELEQAVFCTFLHSQPIGQKATTHELMVMLGQTRPDRIELEKGLRQWADTSWFLDEAMIQDPSGSGEGSSLPSQWRLGSRPNLRQMHDQACRSVRPEEVESRLLDEIGREKSLTAGAAPLGVKVHNLPAHPGQVGDDGDFRYVVLGPKAASDPGSPSEEAVRFLQETTAPDRPRVYRNAMVLVTPSREGLELSRRFVREYLGWERVGDELRGKELDPIQEAALKRHLEAARRQVPEAIRQAYSIVVTVSENDEPEAFKVTIDGGQLFGIVKGDRRTRIRETAVNSEALLPGGPYDLWREGEQSRRAQDLVGVFAQFARLPKMLNPGAILQTLRDGCAAGLFVLRLARPDRSVRTWWFDVPDDVALGDAGLEAFLPEYGELAAVPAGLIERGRLPGLWAGPTVTVGALREYFAGGHVAVVPRDGYEDRLAVPRAAVEDVDAAVRSAVGAGKLWLTVGPASILAEEVPPGLLTDAAVLEAPPVDLSPFDVLPERLGAAWEGGRTTAMSLVVALSDKAGRSLPWVTVRKGIDAALQARLVTLEGEAGGWPCTLATAGSVVLRVSEAATRGPVAPPEVPGVASTTAGGLVAEADLRADQIQDLAEVVNEIVMAAAGLELGFKVRVELSGEPEPSEDVVERVNKALKRVDGGLGLRRGR